MKLENCIKKQDTDTPIYTITAAMDMKWIDMTMDSHITATATVDMNCELSFQNNWSNKFQSIELFFQIQRKCNIFTNKFFLIVS